MRPALRWVVAGLTTAAVFGLATWLGGWALRAALDDPVVRWGLAGAFGVAMAALAALWGHGFAGRGAPRETAAGPAAGQSGDVHNTIEGGMFLGPVTQGGHITAPLPGADQPRQPGSDDRG